MPIFDSEYGTKTTPVDNDKVLIADSENSHAIKGVKISSIISKAVAAVQALTAWITTAMLQDNAVTTEKIEDEAVTFDKIDFSTYKQELIFDSSTALTAWGNVYYRDHAGQNWPVPFTELHSFSIVPLNGHTGNQFWFAPGIIDETGVSAMRVLRATSGSNRSYFKVVGYGKI